MNKDMKTKKTTWIKEFDKFYYFWIKEQEKITKTDLSFLWSFKDGIKTHISTLLSQNYVKGYEDCLEEKYDKAKKHFDKKLAQTRKEVIEELVRKIRGMKKEYDDDVIQRSYDIEHNEALDKVIQKAKELK